MIDLRCPTCNLPLKWKYPYYIVDKDSRPAVCPKCGPLTVHITVTK